MKASRESQLGTAPCAAEDSEEMFWLRQNDDLQSRLELGTALAAQYRYREAADVWTRAAADFPADRSVWLRIGGALLTVRDFEGSLRAYEKYIALGGAEKDAAYALGVRAYLLGDFGGAAAWFEKCLPCGDETLIAVVYWHCLSRLRGGGELTLLEKYRPGADYGHHAAYETVVSVLAGAAEPETALASLGGLGDLDCCIAAYGLYVILQSRGCEAGELLDGVLAHESVWPNVASLAAWNDRSKNGPNAS